MFAPFFTSKRNGTGLGLALVQKIIVFHNGHVDHVAISPLGEVDHLGRAVDEHEREREAPEDGSLGETRDGLLRRCRSRASRRSGRSRCR